jgi:dihydrodipicolinate synthase/N-acetylneuraminate lyase
MLELRGIYPILATPFQASGDLDTQGLERLIDFLMASKLPGVTLFGLAGEYYKLTEQERSYVQKAFLTRTEGVFARIVCISDHSTELALRRAEEATDAGSDALLIMPPFFLSPDTNAVCDHIRAIADTVQIPILVQYAPNLTGIRLSAAVFAGLAQEFPHIQYVKVDSTPAGPMISDLLAESGGRLKPIVGYAGLQMMDALNRGAVGCMPGCSLPEPYQESYAKFTQGDREGAAESHARFLPLINYMMQSVEFIIQCEKSILHWRGIIDSDYCRRPNARLTTHDLGALRELCKSSVPMMWREWVRNQ